MLKTIADIKHRSFAPSLHITFLDGTEANVSQSGVGLSNTQFAEGAGLSVLPVGCAIGKTLQLELVNDNGQWDQKDFFGAVIDLTIDYGNGDVITWEDFCVSEPPESLGSFIIMKCLDNMWRTDKPYSTALVYPSTLGAVWREACNACGLQSATVSHPVFNKSIQAALPTTCTYRQVFGYIAGAAGGNVRINKNGEIQLIDWYFPDENTDTSIHDVHILDNWINLTPTLHDITITGVSAAVEQSDGSAGAIMRGTAGYVLQLEDNPVIKGAEAAYLDDIYSAIGGATLRGYSGSAFFYPVAEFGDACAVVSAQGDVYYSIITDVSWSLGGGTEVKNGMTSPLTSASRYYDPSLRAVIEARKLVAKERTARENAIIALQNALASSSGMYETAELQQDGSTIYYLHDKPTLASSTNIIKLTSEVIGLSTNGGRTYPYGFTLTGNMVTRILSAVGVNADWINTGALIVTDEHGTLLFSADVDAGTVFIDGVMVNNGVVTIGMDSTQMRVTIDSNGVNITENGVPIAKFGSREATLPLNTVIPQYGSLSLGKYRIQPLSGGNFELIFVG